MGLPDAARRWIVRAIAAVLAVLVASLAAAPARADSTVVTVPLATTAGSPPTSSGDATAPPDSQSTPTAPQSTTTTNTQSATATGGAGGSATGGNAGPSQAGGDSHRGDAFANGGRAESQNSIESKQSNPDDSGSHSGGNGRFASDGQDTFVVKTPKGGGSTSATARAHRARSREHSEPGTARVVIRGEAKERGGHETGKASPSDGGLPGHGGQLPSQDPFFSLMSGSGGAGTGLLMLLLAVLGASIALPRHRFNALRTPAIAWRPLAYVLRSSCLVSRHRLVIPGCAGGLDARHQ